MSIYSRASGEGVHSHGSAGEIEHMMPILAIFAVLVIAGFGASYFFNKKK